ncbi:hypothetical protein DEO72_LG8g2976 [Vigna unguiculata]|uniref:Uncharacterized protein n=1 Tax=Vigna unguiculata TaxID=3917 RepID=A0A4D6MW27_VIGUN|nr:hypothetical protein DEO72_LG8g2976 [Vigna unguiculata]
MLLKLALLWCGVAIKARGPKHECGLYYWVETRLKISSHYSAHIFCGIIYEVDESEIKEVLDEVRLMPNLTKEQWAKAVKWLADMLKQLAIVKALPIDHKEDYSPFLRPNELIIRLQQTYTQQGNILQLFFPSTQNHSPISHPSSTITQNTLILTPHHHQHSPTSNFCSPASFILRLCQRLGVSIGAASPQPPGTSSITTAAPPLNGLLLRLFLSRITQHLSPKLPSPASQRCRRRRATTSSVFKPTVVRCDCRSCSTPASYRHSATSEPLASAAISDEGFTLRSRKSS